MSQIPGYRLEDFLMWSFDLVVDGESDANWSMMAVEKLGMVEPKRKVLTKEQFKQIVNLYEDLREWVERKLDEFDEETQSWRDYGYYAFEFTNERDKQALALLETFT